MKYCPSCDAEYLDRATRCADCGVDLVDEEARERLRAAASGEWAMATTLADGLEADRAAAAMTACGLPFHVHRFGETVYIGHTDLHQGYGELWVPRGALARAHAALADEWERLAALDEGGGDGDAASDDDDDDDAP